jgi:hypothetical protein
VAISDKQRLVAPDRHPPFGALRGLDRFASWFIDERAYPDPDDRLRAKVFVVSHFLSPNLALLIAAMLYFVADVAEPPLYWLALGFALFFVYPFTVRWGIPYRVASVTSLVHFSLMVYAALYYFIYYSLDCRHPGCRYVVPWRTRRRVDQHSGGTWNPDHAAAAFLGA